MAVITGFERDPTRRPKRQPTSVVCHWSIAHEPGGDLLLQLDTLGSRARQHPGKQSQTLQLTANAARQLFDILKAEFHL